MTHITPFSRQALYGSSTAEKCAMAKDLFQKISEKFPLDADLDRQLSLLKNYQGDLQQTMASMDLGRFCSECAGKHEGGGCCSLFMADENDSVQLLINLLLGCDITPQRDDGHECIFLGDQGCVLSCKPFFCLNYLCSHIRTATAPKDLVTLERATGKVLQQQYHIEQLLLQILVRESLIL